MNFVDTSGQRYFLHHNEDNIREADAIVFVYDITNPETFTALDQWLWTVNRVKPRTLPKMLIGNKLDMMHVQAVSASKAKEWAIPEGRNYS